MKKQSLSCVKTSLLFPLFWFFLSPGILKAQKDSGFLSNFKINGSISVGYWFNSQTTTDANGEKTPIQHPADSSKALINYTIHRWAIRIIDTEGNTSDLLESDILYVKPMN